MHGALLRWGTLVFAIALALSLVGCKPPAKPSPDKLKLHIVATTTMIADTTEEIGQDIVRVDTLMQPGVDVHTYNLTEADKQLLTEADLILYNGLGLERRMMPFFDKLKDSGKKMVAISKDIPKDKLIAARQRPDVPGSGSDYDPHIWMDPGLWMTPAKTIADAIIAQKPEKAEAVRTSEDIFVGKMRMLEANIRIALDPIPEKDRILITAHDAFAYWGRAYKFEVKSLLSSDTSLTPKGTTPVDTLATLIVEKNIPAIFTESTVPDYHIKALQKAVEAKSHKVRIARTIYSDSFGDYGTEMASYIGMLRFDTGIAAEELVPPPSK